MKIFGGGNEEEENLGKGYPPVSEVKELMSQGLEDKEVIDKLKEQGFSYSEIEKAMVDALKSESGGIKPAPASFTQPPSRKMETGQKPEMPPLPGSQPDEGEKPRQPSQSPQPQAPQKVSMPEGETEQTYPPEFAVEEIVEGVVEEKWDRFNRKLEQIRTDQSNLREEVNSLLTEARSIKNQSTTEDREIVDKIEDLEKRLEDAEAKAGGLERVFKQFFPKIFKKALSAKKMGKTEEEDEEFGAA